jgi:hypothetical protein
MRHLFLALTAALALAAPAAAQAPPDWSGVWLRSFDEFAAENERWGNPNEPSRPRLTPKAEAMDAERRTQLLARASAGTEPHVAGACETRVAAGMPQVMRFAFGIEFLFTPGRVTVLLEQGPTIRRIFTDGRRHSADPDLTYTGESIGRWEGDTLVVDTRSIRSGTQLLRGIQTSGAARIVERIRLIDARQLQIETTVEDPVMLTAPWRYTRTYARTSEWFERSCDNDRDGQDREPDLTPPPR